MTAKRINDQGHPRLEVTGIEDDSTSSSFEVIAWAHGLPDDKRNTEEVLDAFLSSFLLTVKLHRIAMLKGIYTTPRCCQLCRAKDDRDNTVHLVCRHIADGTAKDGQRLLPDLWLCGDCADTPLDRLTPEIVGKACKNCINTLVSTVANRDISEVVPLIKQCASSSETVGLTRNAIFAV
jgi:hypothetical protein